MYKKQDEGHKRENGDLAQARWTVLEGRAQGELMCTVLLPRLKGVMACKLAERCSVSWYQGKGTSYPSHPDFMRSNGQPSSQPLVQGCKHEGPSLHCVLTAAESVSCEGEMQPRDGRTLEVKLQDCERAP